jgi:S-adenosylmethionine:tRNA ribosyltransferase-isomerase
LKVRDLAQALRPGDLVVVNDSATLPASLAGTTASGEAIEIRLVGRSDAGAWRAVLFGIGDWRMRTEDRPAPPPVRTGDALRFANGLTAVVSNLSGTSARLLELRFTEDGTDLWGRLYQAGRPIQYSYLERPLELWHVQSGFAARPWSFEAPSAGRPVRWELVLDAMRRGIRFAVLTHSAGVSSLGDAELDRQLPFRERYDIPPETANAVNAAKASGGRIVAVGTTVVRALESSALAHGGTVAAGADETNLIITRYHRRGVADGILTGLHEPGSSHLELLRSFASEDALQSAYRHAEQAGYLWHEFGDSMLIVD